MNTGRFFLKKDTQAQWAESLNIIVVYVASYHGDTLCGVFLQQIAVADE